MDERFAVLPLLDSDLKEAYTIWEATSCIDVGTENDYPAVMRRYLERNPDLSYIAREKETGAMVATLVGGTDGLYGTLRHAVVIPEFRGLGIMRKLIEHTLLGFKMYGVSEAALYVFEKNFSGMEYFLRSGWKELEKVRVLVKKI